MTLANDNGTDGQTDRQTDRQSATQYAAPPREEGRIIKLAQVIFKTSFENSQIITPVAWMPVVFKFGTTFVSYFPDSILSFYHISSYPPIIQG